MSILIDNWVAILSTIAAVIIWVIEVGKRKRAREFHSRQALKKMQSHYDMFISGADEYIQQYQTPDNFDRYNKFQLAQEQQHKDPLEAIERMRDDLYWHRIKQTIFKIINNGSQ